MHISRTAIEILSVYSQPAEPGARPFLSLIPEIRNRIAPIYQPDTHSIQKCHSRYRNTQIILEYGQHHGRRCDPWDLPADIP